MYWRRGLWLSSVDSELFKVFLFLKAAPSLTQPVIRSIVSKVDDVMFQPKVSMACLLMP